MAKITYVDKLNNTKIFAERAEYSKDGKNIDTALDSKIEKLSGAISGNLAAFDSSGSLSDSSIAADDVVQDSSYVHTDNNFTDADVSKLASITSGAEVNVIETIQVNGSSQTVTNKTVDISVPTAGIADPAMDGTPSAGSATTWSKSDHVHPSDTSREAVANKVTTVRQSGSADDTHFPSEAAVRSAIDSAVSAAYKAAGTKRAAELTSSLLVAANEGNVYNITEAGTTDNNFVDGAGKTINVGDNVGICKVGIDYKFDLLSGFVDLSDYVQKSNTSGLLKNDGTVDTSDYLTNTGDGSNVTITPDGSSGTTFSSGGKLSALAQKFINLVSSLKALAFKDTASYDDLSSGVKSSLDKADTALQYNSTSQSSGSCPLLVNDSGIGKYNSNITVGFGSGEIKGVYAVLGSIGASESSSTNYISLGTLNNANSSNYLSLLISSPNRISNNNTVATYLIEVCNRQGTKNLRYTLLSPQRGNESENYMAEFGFIADSSNNMTIVAKLPPYAGAFSVMQLNMSSYYIKTTFGEAISNTSGYTSGTRYELTHRTGTYPDMTVGNYASSGTIKTALDGKVSGPLDSSVSGASTSTTTAPCTKAVYDVSNVIIGSMTSSGNATESNYGLLADFNFSSFNAGTEIGVILDVSYKETSEAKVVGVLYLRFRRNTNTELLQNLDYITLYRNCTPLIDLQAYKNGLHVYIYGKTSPQTNRWCTLQIRLRESFVYDGSFLSPSSYITVYPAATTSTTAPTYTSVTITKSELAVKNHASTGTEFGAADSTHYGHTMLSTSITTDSSSNAKAATPKAVADWTGGYKIYVNPGQTPGTTANTIYFC
jgi:hypothetical protein